MFVKLLVLLFSNVFISFSVLLCCRSLASKYGLKGDLVPVIAIDRIRAAIEPTYDRAKHYKIQRICSRAQDVAIKHTPCTPEIHA
jgi:hypothetical protein